MTGRKERMPLRLILNFINCLQLLSKRGKDAWTCMSSTINKGPQRKVE
jgi:hypothetical protein